MAKLTSAKRAALPKSTFGLPNGTKASGGKPSYPMPDKSHAGNAKARATQAVKAGRMSKATAQKIDTKANRILKKGK